MGQLPLDQPRRHEILRALERMLDVLVLDDVAGTAAAARAELAEVLSRPAVPSAHRISAVGHAHIDSAWLWPIRETKRKCARTFSNVLALMDDYPELRFGCSQAAQYEWMLDGYPSVFEGIKRAGRPTAVGSRSAACGSSPTPTWPAARRSCARSPTASGSSRSTSAGARPRSGSPTCSATRRRCPRSCGSAASSGSSPRRCRGTRPTGSRTTRSGGRASTARPCSPTSRRSTATTRCSSPIAARPRRAQLHRQGAGHPVADAVRLRQRRRGTEPPDDAAVPAGARPRGPAPRRDRVGRGVLRRGHGRVPRRARAGSASSTSRRTAARSPARPRPRPATAAASCCCARPSCGASPRTAPTEPTDGYPTGRARPHLEDRAAAPVPRHPPGLVDRVGAPRGRGHLRRADRRSSRRSSTARWAGSGRRHLERSLANAAPHDRDEVVVVPIEQLGSLDPSAPHAPHVQVLADGESVAVPR